MKGVSVFFYSLRQGIKNLKHNRLFTLASIGTIAACLFIFGVFYSVVINLGYMINNVETSVGVTVFFDEGIDSSQIEIIGNDIRAREEVADVVFISAKEAWENFKEDVFGDEAGELAATFGEDNPLKDSSSYEVYLNDVSKQSRLVEYIESMPGVRLVNSSEATAEGLADINQLIGYVSVAIITMLLAVAIFLISTTISTGLSVRSKEIELMRLIGATDLFIQLPFVIEGIVIGLIGVAIPLAVLYYMYGSIIDFISDKFNMLSDVLVFLDESKVFVSLVPVSIAVGVGIGLVRSIWTIRKHMNV